MQWILLIIGLAAGAGLGLFLPSSRIADLRSDDSKKLEEARQEAERIRKDAKEKAERLRSNFKEEEASIQKSIQQMESVLEQKEQILKRREDRNKGYEGSLKGIEKETNTLQKDREALIQQSIDQLSAASKLSRDEAHKLVKTHLETLIVEGKEKRQSAELEEFADDVLRHAQAVLQGVIQRLGVPSSVDRNSTAVRVRDDKFKGMLIGKGGENIAYLESLIPVSVIFNLGSPDTIYVGGLNLLRRHIAKRAINKMQKLVKKTKGVTKDMIKETLEQSEQEIMEQCDQKGRWALKQLNLNPDKVDPELINYIGRMYFRTSYGQNIIHHSLEMAFAARLMSELIGADVDVATQAAFYHDIGKAIDHDVIHETGSTVAHDDLSKDILEKHNYDERIVHAAYAHHDKVPCEAPEDFIVKAVDAISGGRPGARMESVTNYFERMKELESAAKSFEGVQKVFTMSAGREVRVMVNKDQIKDDTMQSLGDKIADKISEEVSFPGIIKVNLIRRTKSVDYARDKSKRH